MAEGEPKETKKKTVWKNVYVDRNPDTGKKYFERRKVTIPEPGEGPPDEKENLRKGYTPTSVSRKKRNYPTFIEKSQPTGDKD